MSDYFSDKFIECLERFYGDSGVSDGSFRTYVARYRTICDYLGKDFLEFTEDDAKRYFDGLIQKYINADCKKSSIYSKLTCFSRLAEYIQVVVLLDSYVNPFKNIIINAPSADLQVARIPSAGDVDKILTAAPSKMYYVIFALAFRTALSVKDIVTLRKSSIVESEGILLVRLSKKERLVPLPEDIVVLLKDYISTMSFVDSEGHLFYNEYNNVLTELNIYKRFQRIVEKLGLDSRYSMQRFLKSLIL